MHRSRYRRRRAYAYAIYACSDRRLPQLSLTQAELVAVQRALLLPLPLASGDDGARRTAYKLLIGIPWRRPAPENVAADAPLYAALGAMFDGLNVRHQRLRQWAYHWLTWSETNLNTLASTWREALDREDAGPRPRSVLQAKRTVRVGR